MNPNNQQKEDVTGERVSDWTALEAGFHRDLSRVQETIDAVDNNRKLIHGFLQRFLRAKGMGDDSALNQFRDIVVRARRALNVGDSTSTDRELKSVPKILHRIWLTDSADPVEPPEVHVQKIIEDSYEYAANGWKLWLWVYNPNSLGKTVSKLEENKAPIEIKDYQVDILSGQSWEGNFRKLISDRKFAFASDLLRMCVLYRHGGVYADLGARFKERRLAEFVVDNFDYAFIIWETLFFQNSLMVMPPDSRIAKLYMQIANEPYCLPKSLFFPLDGLEEGMAFSGLLITALLLFSNPERLRICPLAPNGELVQWSSERSWYTRGGPGSGKYGNAFVPETGASFLLKEKFESAHPMPIFRP